MLERDQGLDDLLDEMNEHYEIKGEYQAEDEKGIEKAKQQLRDHNKNERLREEDIALKDITNAE